MQVISFLGAGGPGKSRACWRALTEDKGFADMPTPTRSCPSLRKKYLPYTKGNPRGKSEDPIFCSLGHFHLFCNVRSYFKVNSSLDKVFMISFFKLAFKRCYRGFKCVLRLLQEVWYIFRFNWVRRTCIHP